MRAQHSNFEAEAEWKLQMLLQCACYMCCCKCCMHLFHASRAALLSVCACVCCKLLARCICCTFDLVTTAATNTQSVRHLLFQIQLTILMHLLPLTFYSGCFAIHFFIPFSTFYRICVCVTARAPSLLLPHLVFFRIKSEFACF